MAVGRKETSRASKATPNVKNVLSPIGARTALSARSDPESQASPPQTSGDNGATITAHGSSSGKLLAFAPTSSAAPSQESQSWLTRPDLQARKPKSTAAKPYTVGKASLPALPA